MTAYAGTSYDEVPYLAASFENTHPATLAVTSLLRGLEPPPLAGTRVLELGCARGANLVPMAWSMPDARFVGVDLSPRQIADAKEMAAAVGVGNVSFHAMDLREVDESFGAFDYVVAHGLFSWVPPDVQEAILELCARRLAPDGIAYISYNTYPGWHVRKMFRDMMLYRVRGIADPATRLQEARAFVRLLADTAKPEEPVWAALAADRAASVEKAADWYLLHDDLEAENNPVYFSEMVERAARHGLQYVTEERRGTADEVLPAGAWSALDRIAGDRIEREQYYDFFRNATFRRSLFARAGRPLAAAPEPERLERCRLRSRVRPVDPSADPWTPGEETFAGEGGSALTTSDTRLRVLLHALYDAWPGTLDYGSASGVLAEAIRRSPGGGEPTRSGIAGLLQQVLLAQLVSPYLVDPPVATKVPEMPVAAPVARHQAPRQASVTNLFHQALELLPLDRVVLPLLDGSRSAADVAAAVAEAVASGRIAPTESGRPAGEEPGEMEPAALANVSLQRLVDGCFILR